MYAILDLESTGGKYNEEGITEVAIYKFDGQNVIDQFCCLINPERKIQPFVAQLTGINNDMLRYAPKFHEVAKRIIEITEDCVLVAHNAKFDYRLLRTEYRRLGYDYKRQTLCTVELSKKLIPDLPSYSLGKLVKSLGIPLTDRHRAIGDAQATVRLFKLLLGKDTSKEILKAQLNRNQATAVQPFSDIVEALPGGTGTYYMHDQQGNIVFVGSSKNIRKSVNQQFTKENFKAKKLQATVHSVSYDLTGNELLAQLIEYESIQKLTPQFNKKSKKNSFSHALYHSTNSEGYICFKLRKAFRTKQAVTTFKNRRQGLKFLEIIARDRFQLAPQLLGLEDLKTDSENNKSILESAEIYNQRAKQLIDQYSLNGKSELLIGKGRQPSEKNIILIEEGIVKGWAYIDLNLQLNSLKIIHNLLTPMTDSSDMRHIIMRYLRKNPKHFDCRLLKP